MLAAHQSGHNSGVIHAGIYYAPGSLKARLCREGKRELEDFATQHAIPFERGGKLVVAIAKDELPGLDSLEQRARANDVPGLEAVGRERITEIEPHAAGLRGLWSPTTGVIDYVAVCAALATEIRQRGGVIETGRGLNGVRAVGDELPHRLGHHVLDGLVGVLVEADHPTAEDVYVVAHQLASLSLSKVSSVTPSFSRSFLITRWVSVLGSASTTR